MLSVWDSVELGPLRLRCRLIRSATAERISMDYSGDVERLIAVYAPLVTGGVGLIVTGHIAVEARGRISPLMAGLFSEQHLQGWGRVVEWVHRQGGYIMGQLNHGGGRALQNVPGGPMSVSALPDRPRDPMRGRTMSSQDIADLIEAFAGAARRLQMLEFDGVQLHAAHGYLISQFLSPIFNRRCDEWGGGLEGRSRFLRMTLEAVRREVGSSWPVGLKLGALDSDPKGLRLEEAVEVGRAAQEAGAAFIEVSGGFHTDIARRRVRAGQGEGYFLALSRTFKRALRIPVIAVGGLRSLRVVQGALRHNLCDAVAMSRPLIREPDLLRRFERDVASSCAGCNLCLVRQETVTGCHRPLDPPPRAGGSLDTGLR